MWPFRRNFDPKTAVLGLLAQARFRSLSHDQRITFTNLRTTSVCDLAVVCELDEIAHYLLDLADRWRSVGQVYEATFGRRQVTIASFRNGCDWECGLTALLCGGARRIIQLGACGSLRDDIRLGDLAVTQTVVVNDDLARSYTDAAELHASGPMLDFVERRARELASGVPVHFVRAISFPAFFRQPRAALSALAARADIVDLEVATTAAMASERGCEWLSAFIIVDRKLHDEDMFTMPDFPMAALFDHGGIMLRAIADGIREFNAG